MELAIRNHTLMGKNSSGYTLIELIVVIAIMGIILSIGLAGWTSYQNKEKLRAETQEVISWLRKIQTKAGRGEKPSADCPTLDYYEINQTNRSLQADTYCLDESGVSVDMGTVDSVTVEEGVSLNLSSSFIFYSNSGVTGQSRTISLTYAGNTYTINISESGKISWQMN